MLIITPKTTLSLTAQYSSNLNAYVNHLEIFVKNADFDEDKRFRGNRREGGGQGVVLRFCISDNLHGPVSGEASTAVPQTTLRCKSAPPTAPGAGRDADMPSSSWLVED